MFERLEGLASVICQKWGVLLYDIDVINVKNGKVLCVYITKQGGITITDCSNVSKDINLLVEADSSLIDNLFNIEVSSPGIERTLKFKKHYNSSINEALKIVYLAEAKKVSITGVLREVNSDFIVVESEDKLINIPFQNIKKARTFYQAPQKTKSGKKVTKSERSIQAKETE